MSAGEDIKGPPATYSFNPEIDPKKENSSQRVFLKHPQAPFHHNKWNMGRELQRQWSRRRLRRLLTTDKRTKRTDHRLFPRLPAEEATSLNWLRICGIAVLVISSFVCLAVNRNGLANFLTSYTNNYQFMVNNKVNYCGKGFEADELVNELRQSVINQDEALDQLEEVLGSPMSFQSIVFAGSSGVGKSLTALLLHVAFPWSENVHSLAWNDDQQEDDKARLLKIEDIFENLSDCGRNLLIIDNMSMVDVEFVSLINSLALRRHDVANSSIEADLKQLTIIYVINLRHQLHTDLFWQHLSTLQELPQTTVIPFKTFSLYDLEQCVRLEARLENRDIDESFVRHILKHTNVALSGCKLVHAKVQMYGTPRKTDL